MYIPVIEAEDVSDFSLSEYVEDTMVSGDEMVTARYPEHYKFVLHRFYYCMRSVMEITERANDTLTRRKTEEMIELVSRDPKKLFCDTEVRMHLNDIFKAVSQYSVEAGVYMHISVPDRYDLATIKSMLDLIHAMKHR